MKTKVFKDLDGDRVTVEPLGRAVNLICRDKVGGRPREALVCMDADTTEAVGRRLIKVAKKLRKAEADGET